MNTPEGTLPAATPLAGDPPATPPVGDPPATPPVGDPPATPPAGEPSSFAWPDNLSDDNQALVGTKKWDGVTDVNDILDSYRHLETKLGGSTMAAPKPGADLTEWEGWKQLGVPEDGKYADFNSPKLPDGMNKDEKLEASFLAAAPGLKLTPFQVQGLSDLFADHQIDMMTGAGDLSKQDSDKMDAALRQEWGDDYDAKTDQAQLAARFMGYDKKDDPVLAALEGSLGASGLMQHFAKLGGMLGEDKLESVRAGGGEYGMTMAAAKAEEKRLDADPVFMKAYQDKSDPGHATAVERKLQLSKAITDLET